MECKMNVENHGALNKPQWIIKYTQEDVGNVLPPKFPYIIDDLTGDIAQVALLFTEDKYLTRNKAYNANTVSAYTHDLLDWMRFCAQFGIPWNKANYVDLGHYVDSMELVSPHHNESYAETTITRRLVPILQMYNWALENHPDFAAEVPEGTLFEPKNVAHFLDDRRREKRQKIKVADEPAEHQKLPNVLQPQELNAVLRLIGPSPELFDVNEISSLATGSKKSNSEKSQESISTSIAHLGMDIASQAGLRVSEVVGLKVKYFAKYANTKIEPNRFYKIGPFRRKGGKSKTVEFHGVLLQKVLLYIKGERAIAVRLNQTRHGILLVHKEGRFKGLPISKSTLQRRFTQACIKAGLVRQVDKIKPIGGLWDSVDRSVEVRSAFTFHDLRHTYAVWMYYALKANNDAEPWKYIQEQLGHENLLTTMEIYLKVTQDFEAHVTDKFVETLNVVASVRNL